MLTKFQIAFCVLAGLGVSVFGIGMIAAQKQQAQPQNVNAAKVPGWLAPVAWGSFGLIVASCVGVVATLALDREKAPGSDDDEEAELLPVDEPTAEGDEAPADLTTVEDTEMAAVHTDDEAPAHEELASADLDPMEFAEPGTEETIEFSTLPEDE